MHVVDYEEFELFGNYSLHFDILLCNRCTYAESIKYLKRYYELFFGLSLIYENSISSSPLTT